MNGNATAGNFTVLILAGEAGKNQASAEQLAANLALLEQQGHRVEFITPNGINSYTVVARRQTLDFRVSARRDLDDSVARGIGGPA